MTKKQPGLAQTKGACAICGAIYARPGMARHLTSHLASEYSPPTSKRAGKIWHILAQGHGDNRYWLHLAIQGNARLSALDQFFRDIWVECCGHMSAFYSRDPVLVAQAHEADVADMLKMLRADGIENPDLRFLPRLDPRRPAELDLGAKLDKMLRPGMKMIYEYDFGSTTELELSVIGEYEGTQPDSIRLLARNEAPDLRCDKCGEPATQVCPACAWGDKGFYCEKCLKQHARGQEEDHSPEYALPVVNSPRVGVCGYAG